MTVTKVSRGIAAALVAAATLVVAPQATYGEDGGSANNVVLVRNVADGLARSGARTAVSPNPTSAVTNENLAVASASCTDCRTVAVAVQVVLMTGDVVDYRPANAAVASNEGCLRCQTFAFARQEILAADVPADLSGVAGEVQLIRDQMREAAASEAPFDEMSVELDALTEMLVAVLSGEVEQLGATVTRTTHRRVDRFEQ